MECICHEYKSGHYDTPTQRALTSAVKVPSEDGAVVVIPVSAVAQSEFDADRMPFIDAVLLFPERIIGRVVAFDHNTT